MSGILNNEKCQLALVTFTMKFFLKKTWWIILLLLVGVLIISVYLGKKNTPDFEYTTEPVVQGDLKQTVDATGNVEPASSLKLNFGASGVVKKVFTTVGETVERDDIIARLDNREAVANLQQAQANLQRANADLNRALTGPSKEDIAVSKSQVAQADVNYQNALKNLDAVTAQLDKDQITQQQNVIKAKEALKSAEQSLTDALALEDQNVENLYSSALTTINSTLADAEVALEDGFIMLDTNNAEYYYGIEDISTITNERTTRGLAKTAISNARTSLQNARTVLTKEAEIEAVDDTINALNKTFDNLVALYNMLVATPNNSTLLTQEVSANKAIVTQDQARISGALTQAQGAKQSILSAKLTKESQINNAKAAVIQAKQNVAIAEAALEVNKAGKDTSLIAAQAQVDTAKAGLDAAQAQFNLKTAPVRESDVAAYRAVVRQLTAAVDLAQKRVDDTYLRSPINGVVTEVNIKEGEQTNMASNMSSAVSVMSNNNFHIDVDISEADIAKIAVNDPVKITFDAFGEDEIFTGVVAQINPSETVIQEVIYYTITIDFETRGMAVKSGMTANLTIQTDQRKNVLYIPRRAVFDKGDKKAVRVLENNEPIEVDVETGLRANDGLIEITNGLHVGQDIVTFIKELK